MSVDTPVRAEDRLQYMDVLRGFAVMAIFIVNIKVMFAPYPYYMNPTLWSGDNDLFIAELQAIFVDHKWRTIFTALFGAGLVLIADKAAAAGADAKRRVTRRLIWLLIFGAIHAFAIWYGDILLLYAVVGFIAINFAGKSAGSLAKWAALFLTTGLLWLLVTTAPVVLLPEELLAEAVGQQWGTNPDFLQAETDAFLGPVSGHFLQRAILSAFSLINYVFGGIGLLTLGIMLAGMALFRTGFLKGQWSATAYLVSALTGLGLCFGANYAIIEFVGDQGWSFKSFAPFIGIQIGLGLVGAYGYAALIGLIMKTGIKFSPVAAAGRMAFSNYIACSLIGTTMAYGTGFGMFGSLTLQELMMVAGGTFLAMLIWSPLWLAIFRFGPLEWLWRSLTYGRVQPLLK